MPEADTLWQSYANACRAGVEIDALMEALRELLADGGLGSLRIEVDSEENSDLQSDQGWAVGYALYSFKIVPARGRAVNRGYLSLGVSLWRPEDERGAGWDGAQTAKLYVGFSPPRAAGWSTESLVLDGAGQSLDTTPLSSRRWRGTGPNGMSEAWFYCIQLFALHSRTQLEREVAIPLKFLLENRSEEHAFAGSQALLPPPPNPI